LSPAEGGVENDIFKRQGPPAEEPLFVPLTGMPVDRHSVRNMQLLMSIFLPRFPLKRCAGIA
jgi:hypothetical protein